MIASRARESRTRGLCTGRKLAGLLTGAAARERVVRVRAESWLDCSQGSQLAFVRVEKACCSRICLRAYRLGCRQHGSLRTFQTMARLHSLRDVFLSLQTTPRCTSAETGAWSV